MRTLDILIVAVAILASGLMSIPADGTPMDSSRIENSSFCTGDEADNTTCIIEEIEYFIDLGEKEIELDHENVVLLIGLSRAGKTTLVQFVANDTNTLKSVETFPGSGRFLIVDEGELQNQTIISQTFLPKLVYNEASSAAYYDCPGFNDNRNVSVEVANTYFIKMIADYAKTVKLIVVASDSTFEGNNGVLFPALMQALVGLLKNPDKFEKGISLVPTASTPGHMVNGSIYLTVYSRFLSDIGRRQIETWPEGPDKASAHKILDIMLQPLETNPDSYGRIGYFRVPIQEGYLRDIPFFQENKQFLLELVERTGYTSSNSADFGYSLSPHAIMVIQKLVTVISQKISNTMWQLESVVFETLGNRSLDVLTSEYPNITSFAMSLKHLKDKNFPDCQSLHATTPKQCIESIKANITSYDVSAEEYFSTLDSHSRRLSFFVEAAEGLEDFIEYSLWTLPFADTYSRLDSEFSATFLPQREMEMDRSFTLFAHNVTEKVLTRLSQIESLTPEELVTLLNILSAIDDGDFTKCTNNPGLSPSEYTTEIADTIAKIDPDIDPALLQDVMVLGTALDELMITAQFSFTIYPQRWVQPLLTIRQEVFVVLRSLAQSFSDRISHITTDVATEVFITFRTRSSAVLTSEYTNIALLAHSLKQLKEKTFPDCRSISETTPLQCIESMERNITSYDMIAEEHFQALKSQSGVLTMLSGTSDEIAGLIDYSNWTKTFDEIYSPLDYEFSAAYLPQREIEMHERFTLFAGNVTTNAEDTIYMPSQSELNVSNKSASRVQPCDFSLSLTVPGLNPSAYTGEIAKCIILTNLNLDPTLVQDVNVMGAVLDQLRNTAGFTFAICPPYWVQPLLQIGQ